MLSVKNKFILILAICMTVLFVLSGVLNITQYNKINLNNYYFSQKISTEVYDFCRYTYDSDQELNSAIKSGQIKRYDLNVLGNDFYYQSTEFQDLLDFENLKTSSDYSNNFSAKISESFSSYVGIKMLDRSLNNFETLNNAQNDTITLTSDQISKFQTMKTLDDQWVKSIAKNVKAIPAIDSSYVVDNNNTVDSSSSTSGTNSSNSNYTNIYAANAVNNPYWKNLIKDIVDYGRKLGWGNEMVVRFSQE